MRIDSNLFHVLTIGIEGLLCLGQREEEWPGEQIDQVIVYVKLYTFIYCLYMNNMNNI